MKLPRLIVLAMLVLMLGGCGFTLRGTADLPPELQTLLLESPAENSDMVREMRRTLRSNAITLVDAASSAGVYRLGLGGEESSERALSVNQNARAGEYEIIMRVPFQLRLDATVVFGPEVLSVAKVYLADPENAVAKNDEAELIRAEMRKELSLQILRRLQALEL